MKTYRIRLHVPSGFITPWHADTVFGHLCWVAQRHDGFANFQGAAELIDIYRTGKPPFIISDGFPGDYLPAPANLCRLFESDRSAKLNRETYSDLKKIKSLDYLTREQFAAYRRGERFDLLEDSPKPLRSAVTLHNQISRLTNTTGGEGGGLFELEEKFLGKEALETITIYIRIAAGFEADVRRLFDLFAAGGFGKKRSTGKGGFSLSSFEPCTLFEAIPSEKATGFTMLSHFVPARLDPSDGVYRIVVKYGKLGEEKTFCGNPFKKPLIMIRPGAVFRADAPRPWYGRLIDNVAFADPSVVQYGFGFAVPVIIGHDWT